MAPRLPDVNAETNPFEVVQRLLDQAAFFDLHVGSKIDPGSARRSRDVFDIEGGFVVHPSGTLRQLDSVTSSARVVQSVGQSLGTFESRWAFAPDDFEWSPDREPPAVLFEPGRPQRFVVRETTFDFGSRIGSLRVYGLGQTFPVRIEGNARRQVLVGAVTNIVGGTGAFTAAVGTLVFNGRLTRDLEFQGNVTVRILDPDQRLHDAPASGALAKPAAEALDDQATYIVLRGQKKDKYEASLYSYNAGSPIPIGLDTPAELHAAEYRAKVADSGGLRTQLQIGRRIGHLNATITFNIDDPPGTAAHPNKFQTRNTYQFTDDRGRVIGGIRANVELGRTFDLRFDAAPGQAGLRYGGVGPIVGSSGVFTGVQGLVAVNSVVGVAPHALSLLNVLRIVDPEGQFRSL